MKPPLASKRTEGGAMSNQKKRVPENLPTAIAYFTYGKLLRPYLHPGSSFVICFIVEDEGLFEHHEIAINMLMERRKAVRPSQFDRSFKVNPLFRKSGKTSRVFDDALTARRVIYLATPAVEFPDELQAAADAIHAVTIPDVACVRAAVRLISGEWPGKWDAILIGGAPWAVTAACFRPGRGLENAMSRLKKFAIPQPMDRETDSETEDAPTDDALGETPNKQSLEGLVGCDEARQWGLELKEDIASLRMGKIGWEDLDTGVLLSGPPGTGKTLFASVLATSCAMPFFPASYAEWQSAGSMDDQLKAMRKTFATAQEEAPSIVLIDELDSFGRRGGGFVNRDYMNAVLNGLLECLDGSRRRRGVIVIGTTNFPKEIDAALLRPGRIGRHIAIGLPDAAARLTILAGYLGKSIPEPGCEEVSELTHGMSGDDLRDVARRASRFARLSGEEVDINHVLSALPTRVAIHPDRLRVNAIHECGHVVVAHEFGEEIEELRISDMVLQNTGRDQWAGEVRIRRKVHGWSTDEYLQQITILLGGVAAEREIFSTHDDGAGGTETSDLAQATHLATLVVACFGMGRTLVSEPYLDARQAARLRQENKAIWREVDETLKRQLDRAADIVKRQRALLEKLAEKLLAVRRMTGEEIAHLLTPNKNFPQ